MHGVPFALDRHFVPDTFGDVDSRPSWRAALAVDDLEEIEGLSQCTRANIIIIIFILDTESDAGHLLDLALNELEERGDLEIAEHFAVENEHGSVFVRAVLRKLRKDRAPAGGKCFAGEAWKGLRQFVEDGFPFARRTLPTHDAAETGGRIAGFQFGEIENLFRGIERDRTQQKGQNRQSKHPAIVANRGGTLQFIFALGIEELMGAIVVGFGNKDLGGAVEIALIGEFGFGEFLGGSDAVFFEHGYEHLGVDKRAGVEQLHESAQPGSILASSGVGGRFARSFISARMPIMPALSVQIERSASRREKPACWQAASRSRRNVRLLVTPPEAVTTRTPRRLAARIVFWTRTSTIAACTLAQRSQIAAVESVNSGCFWRK